METDIDIVGNIIGNRYHIDALLGGGGMGIVYKATDRFTGDEVALKQVHMNPTGSSFALDDSKIDFRIALAHEFKTMASLRHPHIISVLDYGFDDDNMPFYTMELMQEPQRLTTVAHQQNMTKHKRFHHRVTEDTEKEDNIRLVNTALSPENLSVSLPLCPSALSFCRSLSLSRYGFVSSEQEGFMVAQVRNFIIRYAMMLLEGVGEFTLDDTLNEWSSDGVQISLGDVDENKKRRR